MCRKCAMDPLRAKVWADKGARTCPGHPDVFELKVYFYYAVIKALLYQMDLLV